MLVFLVPWPLPGLSGNAFYCFVSSLVYSKELLRILPSISSVYCTPIPNAVDD